MNYVLNPNHDNGKATCPKTGIVSLINDEETSYKTYTLVYSQIRVAYDEMRDDMSNELFGKNFSQLSHVDKKKIAELIPIKVSEADPSSFSSIH